MRVSIPTDADGLIGRECPNTECSPGYFKVKPGTGITGEVEKAYCPYCRREAEPSDFGTEEQLRYAKDVLAEEVRKGLGASIANALGLDASGRKKIDGGLVSVEVSLRQDAGHYVRPPVEDEIRRDVTCPHCGLFHSVFGLAIWCPDCGKDIFLSHVEAEYGIVKTILADAGRRRETLGARVAARDIENALEDTVSIFEATLRAITARCLMSRGRTSAEVDDILRKKVGNSFQNVRKAAEVAEEVLELDLYAGRSDKEIDQLRLTFEKRHPITHNLGVVDRQYLARVNSAEKEGRDIRVTVGEVYDAIAVCMTIITSAHGALFRPPTPDASDAATVP